MTFRFTSASVGELQVALLYYESQEPGLGSRFLDEVEATIARVVAMPEAWKPLSPRCRRCLLHKFPFGVIYQVRDEEILIVSLMDLRRNPESWKHLL